MGKYEIFGERMKINTVEHTKLLPNTQLVCYQIDKYYTQQDAIEAYQEKYRATPSEGWMWTNYLYFEISDKEPKK
jgi:hypothetical protein